MTVSPDGRVVIIGTGIAGATAAETLRKEGFTGSIVLVGDDPSPPYRRPMVSKEILAGADIAKSLLRPNAFWPDNSIELRTGTSVESIDVDAARVVCEDGTALAYDALIIATGGRARRLASMPPDAHHVRHLHDAAPLRTRLTPPGTASLLVIGGGLVGMEVAASARAAGADVTVLEAGERVLERALPGPVAEALTGLHRERGVVVHTGVRLEEVTRAGGRTRASARDGREWVADAVVVAVGMTPNDELASRAGLTVDDGIVVDEFCATSAPGVFAAGDVARFPRPVLGGAERIEHWNHAQAHGAAAARNALGIATAYADVPWCWTTQFGRTVQTSGWPAAATEVFSYGDAAGEAYLALGVADGRLVSATGVGRPRDVRAARTLIEDGIRLSRTVLEGTDIDLTRLAAGPGGGAGAPVAVAPE
ncbi:NAD(P)/FAD-dependent oxidoreductase [Nocardia nova]|uniref:NAD(P)/FAD-dependent oxidoreductase n=1 Tax=Nocardia nova TaxID=37330 RepID=UPI0034013942